MNIYASQCMADFIHAALIDASSAIAEIAVDLESDRIKSDLHPSELHGIYFSIQLYAETIAAMPRKPSSWDQRYAKKDWFGNPADLRGHVRAIECLKLAMQKADTLLKQTDVDKDTKYALYGLLFGVEASVNVLEAYLKSIPGRLTPVYAVAM